MYQPASIGSLDKEEAILVYWLILNPHASISEHILFLQLHIVHLDEMRASVALTALAYGVATAENCA